MAAAAPFVCSTTKHVVLVVTYPPVHCLRSLSFDYFIPPSFQLFVSSFDSLISYFLLFCLLRRTASYFDYLAIKNAQADDPRRVSAFAFQTHSLISSLFSDAARSLVIFENQCASRDFCNSYCYKLVRYLIPLIQEVIV